MGGGAVLRRLFPVRGRRPVQRRHRPGLPRENPRPGRHRSAHRRLLVRYIEMQVYQAVVDNLACEQCARMMAMKNATENAKDMINDLNLEFNKARQTAITTEMLEIVGGAEALSN